MATIENYPSATFISYVIHVFMFDKLWMAVIMDFDNYATSNMFIDVITMSGIPQNLTIDTNNLSTTFLSNVYAFLF